MEDKKWEGKTFVVDMQIDGVTAGYGHITIRPDGSYDTEDIEEEFGKMLRHQKNTLTEQANEEEKEFITDNITHEQEEKLKDFHADQCDGVLDDDMPDDYENWLEELDIDSLKNIIK